MEEILEEITTNIYEQNPKARKECLLNLGYACKVCNKNLEDIYGNGAKYLIHVHHIKPLSEIGGDYKVVWQDLIPICPNCHAIIHTRKNPCLTIDELKEIIKEAKTIQMKKEINQKCA